MDPSALDPHPGQPARRRAAPALAVAGALSIGAAMGHTAAGLRAGGPIDLGGTTLITALGVAALIGCRPGAGRRRPSPRTAAIVALLSALAGARTWTQPPTDPRGGAGQVAAAHRHRHAHDRSNRSWDLGDPAGAATFECHEGLLRPGEVVHILRSAPTPSRARSLYRPLVVRRLPTRPQTDEIVRLGPGPSAPAAAAVAGDSPVARMRRAGIRRCLDHPDPDTGGLLAALLFGDPSRLEPGIADLFTRTGTRHLLALSGFHVGLLGLMIAIPLARLFCALAAMVSRLAGAAWSPGPALPTAFFALAFIPLSGNGAPAARAAIALSLAVIGPLFGRRPSGLNLLGVALVLEIAIDPHAPLRPGLQLSYLATLALVIATPTVTRRVLARAPGGGAVAPVSRSGRARSPLARALAEWFLRAVAIGAATSLIASAATLPIVWTRFGEWSPVGIVATPLATLPLVVLVASGWLWLALPALVGSELVGWAAHTLLEGLALADHAPWSPLPLPERPLVLLAGAAALALVGAAHHTPRTARRALRASAILFAVLCAPWPAQRIAPGGPRVRPETLEVHVLDVGNGTSIVVRAPGSRTWVFDAGSRDRVGVGTDAVGALLRALDVGRVDVALSHDDADHARDLPRVARRWPPGTWAGPDATTRETTWRGPAPAARSRRVAVGSGRLPVTGPASPLSIEAICGGFFGRNEDSIALDIRWRAPGGRTWRVVLTGDAEDHGLAAALAGDADGPWLIPGPVDALLIPHHGSDSRQLGPLLDHLMPREAFVSGSGRPAVGAELARRCVRVWSTGVDGPFLWKPVEIPVDPP